MSIRRLRERDCLRLVTDTQLELLKLLYPHPTPRKVGDSLSPQQGPNTRSITEEAISPILEGGWVTIRGSVVVFKSYTQSEWALLSLRAGSWKMMRGHVLRLNQRHPVPAPAGLLSSLSRHLEGMWTSHMGPPEGAADGAGVGSRDSQPSRQPRGSTAEGQGVGIPGCPNSRSEMNVQSASGPPLAPYPPFLAVAF